MKDKFIISAIISVIFISIIAFAFSENALKNEEISGSWTLSFENPQGNSLFFNIANYSGNQNFTWQFYAGSQLVDEGAVNLKNNKEAAIDIDSPMNSIDQKKCLIRVTSEGGQAREIYKNF